MLRTELIRPLPQLLKAHAENFGGKVAFHDARRTVTYAELELRTRRLAGHLAELRLQPGDRALILLGNSVETIETYLAILRAGAIGVPVNPRVTEDELAYLIEDSGARLVVTDPARAGLLARATQDLGNLRVLVTGDGRPPADAPPGALSFAALAETDPATPARDDLGLDDLAWMLYTSGTTGRPKGVLSTQRNCLWSVAACYVPVPGLSAEDRVLWPLPLFHSLAHIVCVLGVTAVGATARILDGFSADEVLDALAEDASTFLAGVPTMYQHLVRAARDRGFRAPSLRMCLVGGAITTAALRKSFEEAFDAPLLDAYGSTETCGSITINWPTGARVEGSCGLPVPGLGVRVVDPGTGLDTAPGEEGEVWVRGPSVMVGYHNRPEETAAALRDGWYHTGDLARRDAEGYFTITGRTKELIIRGGENIHPTEVEDVLRTVPGVADVAVVGKPHDVLGEVPVAFLVPGPEGLDPARLLAVCRERLSYFKVPEELYEIASVPRTASGKITRHVLFDQPARLRATSGSHYQSLFRLDWIPQTSVPPRPEVARNWAVVGPDAFGVGEALARHGVELRTYTGFEELHAAVADGAAAPDVAVVSCGAGVRRTRPLADSVNEACDRLTGQLDAWTANRALDGSKLVVVTRRAVAVGSDADVEDLLQAPLWGLVRSAQNAHPDRFALVDLDDSAESTATLPVAVSSGETQFAVRDGIALLPRLARVSAPAEQDTGSAFPPRRTVLVTGADTPAGVAVARHLVAGHGVRRLLLQVTRNIPGGVAEDLRAELAALGAQARILAFDVTDRDQLAAALDRQSLSAVVHTVGAAGTDELCAAAVQGAFNLHELTRTMDLSSFVLFSSATGVLGDATRRGQAAAHVFLDALAGRRRAMGLPALSLAWGAWEPTQSHTAGVPAGTGPLSTQDGLAMFDAAQTVDQAFLVAMRLDTASLVLHSVPALMSELIDAPRRAKAPDEATASALRTRLTGLRASEQHRMLLDLIRDAATAALGADAPQGGAERSFKELGFTSVTAVALRDRLVAATGLSLPATLAFDCPTPTAVARRLRAELLGVEETPVSGTAPVPLRGTAAADDPVVIVGMACRLPGGVESPEDLWRLVSDGVDAVSGFPVDRGWDA
ncbi:AMP-binding protein, partial [Streptomyces sp. NPDC058335]|uniref:AMP-binding protein n=1 Tax=Streptomyces sp. NPDC058335 TaxID=3346451 RepID=UPI003668AE69